MADMCESCPYKGKVEVIENTVESHEEMLKSYGNRLTEAEKQIIVINTNYTNIIGNINEIKKIVEDLRDKPAKRWESMVQYAITTIIGILLGYLVNGIIP